MRNTVRSGFGPMKSMAIAAGSLALVYGASLSFAQDSVSDPNPGLTLGQVQAIMPQPASTTPPVENVAPTVGTPGTYRPADAVAPRITRATTVTTAAGGTFSGTWATPLSVAPTIVMTPISAATSIDCQLTAMPTTSTFQGRCWSAQSSLLNLSIITAGLTLNPTTATAAGVQIQIIAIPPTQ